MRRKRMAGIFHIVKKSTAGDPIRQGMENPRPFPCGGPPRPSFSVHVVFSRAAPCHARPFCFPVRSGIPARLHAVPLISGVKLVFPNFSFDQPSRHRVSSRNTRCCQSVALFTIAHVSRMSNKSRLTFQKIFPVPEKKRAFRTFFQSVTCFFHFSR